MNILHSQIMHQTKTYDRRVEITLFDPKNRRAVCALLPEAMVKQIDNLWKSDNAHYLHIGEWELIKEANRIGRPISPMDFNLRVQFWMEYDHQQSKPDQHYPALNMSRVIGRSISKEVFYKYIITDPIKLAWILTPPTHLKRLLETALSVAIESLIEILHLPVTDKNGVINDKLMMKRAKIAEDVFRYTRGTSGELLKPPSDGVHGGETYSDTKLKSIKVDDGPKETAVEKAERLKLEIEALTKPKDG